MHVLEKESEDKGQHLLTGLSTAVLFSQCMGLELVCLSRDVNPELIQWLHFLLMLVQIREKAFAFIPGGSDVVLPVSEATSISLLGMLQDHQL